jgi:hypothetical protein
LKHVFPGGEESPHGPVPLWDAKPFTFRYLSAFGKPEADFTRPRVQSTGSEIHRSARLILLENPKPKGDDYAMGAVIG